MSDAITGTNEGRNVLWTVGIDGSDCSGTALRWAAALAHRTGGRVQPVFTWEVPLPIWATAGRRAIEIDRAGLEASAAHAADQLVAGCGELGGVIDEPVVTEGHPSARLLEWSEAGYPLVVGRRGVGKLHHRLLGSTSGYLATHAPGPVVVVPQRPATDEVSSPQRIVVGFDGSDHAAAALRWALDIAPRGAEVEALAAVDVIPWLEPGAVVDRHPEAIESATARMNDVLDRVDPDRRARRTFVLHGPHQAFTERFADADLVVVGPRGLGAVARTVLGSLTMWLLNEAPCPVAIVPSDD